MTRFSEKFVPFCLMMASIIIPIYLTTRTGVAEFLLLEVPIVSWWLSHIWTLIEEAREQNV